MSIKTRVNTCVSTRRTHSSTWTNKILTRASCRNCGTSLQHFSVFLSTCFGVFDNNKSLWTKFCPTKWTMLVHFGLLVSHYSAIGDTISCDAPYSAIGFRGKPLPRYPLVRPVFGGVAAIFCDSTENTVRQGYCYTCLAIGGYFGRVTKFGLVIAEIRLRISLFCPNWSSWAIVDHIGLPHTPAVPQPLLRNGAKWDFWKSVREKSRSFTDNFCRLRSKPPPR